MTHTQKVKRLAELVSQFQTLVASGSLDMSSEATARSWTEEVLTVFGWNCLDPYEVDQEVSLSEQEKQNLDGIDSNHSRPDYLLCTKSKSLIFIDAKRFDHTIETNKKSAFQIRSYGWSAGHPYAVITNFREIAIYDCRYKPNKEQEANVSRIFYCKFEDMVDNFSIIFNHLDKEFVLSGQAFDFYKLADRPSGTLTLDEDFSEHIREWRLKFANSILRSSQNKSIEFIAEGTQLLIDRIIFCRVAEGLQIVPKDSLLSKRSWGELKKYFSDFCFDQFGGMLFEDVKLFSKFLIEDILVKEFIETLYYPNPYRFDVITPALLGNIYERYLGRKLVLKANKIVDDFKEEYQKTKGAVYTPEYIVNSICEKTIEPLIKNKSVKEIMKIRVLDPSCGSGSFLLGVFDYLSDKLVESRISSKEKSADAKLFWSNPRNGRVEIRVFAKRQLINDCMFGVDIDPQAVVIARLSLSLKALEAATLEPIALQELGLLEPLLLNGIGANVKLGNSLVDSSVFTFMPKIVGDVEALMKLKPFDWEAEKNFGSIMASGGFDAVVGNPPYIEIKHYKKNSPAMHEYLSSSGKYESCGSGTTDISMPFIEKALSLLKPKGRLGFIIQSRFFKTDYGHSARSMISKAGGLEQIIDFGSLKVFEKRTTYTAMMIFNKAKSSNLEYVKIDSLNQIGGKLLDRSKFDLLAFATSSNLGCDPWFFVHPDLREFRQSVLNRSGTIESLGENLSINVGLQVLYKKYYLIRGIIKNRMIVGQNYAGIDLKIEEGSCRPLAVNRKFFPFKKLAKDNFALFPYDIVASKDKKTKKEVLKCESISFSKLKNVYPLAHKYLQESKAQIQDNVETDEGADWHLYTYEKNHCIQSLPKILVPSTSLDTSATVDSLGEFYQDNVRINSIVINGATVDQYFAVAAVFNSRAYDCLAKITAETLDNGYIQLNKQFILPVPIPIRKILDTPTLVNSLSKLYLEASNLANKYALANDKETREAISGALLETERRLNDEVNGSVYAFNEKELSVLERFCNRSSLVRSIDLVSNDVSDLEFVEDVEAG